MRTIFISHGRAKSEKLKVLTERIIEMREGYHPVNPEAIWYDDQRRGEPLMIIWSNIINPLGTENPVEKEKNLRQEIEIMKRARLKPHVNKMWLRQLTALLDVLKTYGMVILILLIIAGGIISSILPGGH